jgi:purine nucleosidase
MRRFLIDTDTASDDAVALVLALRNAAVHVEALTVVAGNVPLAMGLQNALYTVELCGAQTPVYAGCAKPLLRAAVTAQEVHGNDGMGDIGLPLRGRAPAEGNAIDIIRALANRYAGELELITLGPLTNIALALLTQPGIAGKIKQCYAMGGTSDGYGNIGVMGEYNIWADPEAAKIVFESAMPMTMIGWDISRKYAVFNYADEDRIRAVGTPLARFCMDIQAVESAFCRATTQLDGFDLPDPIAMAVALDDAIALRSETHAMTVELGDGPARGHTVIDHLGVLKLPRSVRVVYEADRERFLQLLLDAVAAPSI